MSDRTRPRRRPRRKGGTLKDGERRQLARASRHAADPAPQPEPAAWARLHCDGGSRGNPGPAAAAAVLLDPSGRTIEHRAEAIGWASAAEAEYRAILLGLELATAHGSDPLEIRSDSQLAIAALRGATPAAPELAELVREILQAAERLSAVRWQWHPRAANDHADALVRELLWP
jgi:ribonuclease HI